MIPSRYTLLFLLLVGIPLLLIGWLGIMLLRQQLERSEKQFAALVEERLDAQQRLMSDVIYKLESELDRLLFDTSPDGESLDQLPRRQPLVRHAFLLNPRGKLVWPPMNVHPESEAAAFQRRTESVWEMGIRTSPNNETADAGRSASSGPASSSWTVMKQSMNAPLLQKAPSVAKDAGPPATSGWHVWFYGNGPRLLFWQMKPDRHVTGVELEMSAFLSLLLNQFSSDDAPQLPGIMQLVAADGRSILHQWGNGDVDRIHSSITQRECALPLTMWRFHYRPAHEELSAPLQGLPILLGSGGACLALLAVAWLFHRESTREKREAERRVSFVNQVSHELKTPLTNIQLYTGMAQQQAGHTDDAALQRHLHVVEAETSRLSRLIHNVLTFARQQRHQLSVHPRSVVLEDVVRRVIATWQPCLEAKGFQVHHQEEAPIPVLADPDAIEQIIGNLLSNVEKYAADGRYVSILTRQSSTEVQIAVEDHGPGIPAPLLDRIFAPFVRARDDLQEGVSGTGIGLSISRELARLHGGTLTATSTGNGARFILTIPSSSR